MLITVNGKTKELQNTLTIGQYLEENSYVPSQIAVELNERILSKAEYSTTVLHEQVPCVHLPLYIYHNRKHSWQK